MNNTHASVYKEIKGVNVNSYVTMLIDDRILDDPPGHV